jgi:hydroxymethylpyrimidine/phosphomethylpyrimidine kinase
MRKALTIAGSDCSGGAGIQADLKTFAAHAVYGMSVITAVTAQNTLGVSRVQDLPREIISQQLDAVFSDIPVDSLKVGMVSQASTIDTITQAVRKWRAKNVVIDPVMFSKNGYPLLQPAAIGVLIHKLFPLAALVTPNIPEAEVITGRRITCLSEMEVAAIAIAELGPRWVLVKGGHLEGDAVDVLCDGANCLHLSGRRIPSKHTHGTGCTLSAAISANLAQGLPMTEAVLRAKRYLSLAIEHGLEIGKGVGPTNHFSELYRRAGVDVVE